MEILEFRWNVKEKPEDFIVNEEADHEFDIKGEHYLYLLEKKNYTTQELSQKFGFSYAGLKDKTGITTQYVSLSKFIGNKIENIDEDRYYKLVYIGRIRKKVKLGRLKGNSFKIKLKERNIILQNWFINYYDIQRLKNNYERGKQILKKIKNTDKTRRQLLWIENFLIDSYLSYLWNRCTEHILKENFSGRYILEENIKFFIPEENIHDIQKKLPLYIPILGYKVEIDPYILKAYKEVLNEEEIRLKELIHTLKKLRIKGDYRKSYITVDTVCIHNGYLHFYLPKGSYATMFLKHIYRGK